MKAGAGALIEKKPRPKQLRFATTAPLKAYRLRTHTTEGSLRHTHKVEMTKAEYGKIDKDNKWTYTVENSQNEK